MVGAAVRKEPASTAQSSDNQTPEWKSKPTLVDKSTYQKVFKENPVGNVKTIRVKKSAPKQTKPGNWKESEIVDSNKTSDANASEPQPSVINSPHSTARVVFPTGQPMSDKVDIVKCNHCKRVVAKGVAEDHIKRCLDKKHAKAQRKKEAKEAKDAALRKEKGGDDADDSQSKNARKSAVKGSLDDTKLGKKRKVDADAEKGPNAKKKKKDEPKAKLPKPKQPVDVEKQCGVLLPNGAMCARSLTCKSHSMGAKRAVPGRSLPYDVLLANYQKKNQARQQRAIIDANAPLNDEDAAHGPVDSDEEKEAVMAAIARSHPQPLATRPLISTRSKYQFIRMKEMLHNALGGSRGAGLFSVATGASAGEHQGGGGGMGYGLFGAGGGAGVGGEGPGGFEGHARRMSGVVGTRQILPGQLPPPTARKASVSGQA